MHPKLEQLLDLRDGNGDAGVASHVRVCGRCSDVLAELRATAAALRALPEMAVAENQWPQIAQRAHRQRRRSAMIRGAITAAGVLAVFSAVMVMHDAQPGEVALARLDQDAQLAIEELTSASQELELVLKTPSLRNQVMSPQRAAIIVDIEDRITLVDLALAEGLGDSPDELAVALWSDRVGLLDALVTVRTTPVGSDAIVYANNSFEGSNE